MRFGYAGDRAWWQAGPMPIAITASWDLPIWAIHPVITGVTRRHGPGIQSPATTTHGASWTSAWLTARPAPVRTGDSVVSFPPATAAVAAGPVTA